MTQRLIRLTLYDEKISSALDKLSKSRKQSMFVIEALRHFLGTEEGQHLLLVLTGPGPALSEERKACKSESERSSKEEKTTSNLDDIFR